MTEVETAVDREPVSLWPMWVLGLVIMVDQVDQNILRGAASPIQHTFHLSDFEVGALLSAYTIANGFVSLPAGYLADRWVRRRGISVTLLGWSAITGLTAAAWSYPALLTIRTALGCGQAVSEPSASSLLSDLYPRQRRGTAFAVQQCLSFIGFGLGLGIGGVVASQVGWREAFLIVGLPGALVALAVWRLREPDRGEAELASAVEASARPGVSTERPTLRAMVGDVARAARIVVGIPTLRFALVGVSALLFTVTAVASALPQFYEHQLGRSTGVAAALTGLLIVVAGVPGVVVGGRIADGVATRMRGGRMSIPAVCLLAGEGIFVVSFAHLPFAVVYGVEVIGTFVVCLAVPALKAGISDALPPAIRGTGFAVFNIVSVVAGQGIAAVVVFSIAGALGSDYRSALLAVSPGVAAGALVLFGARRHLDRDTAAAAATVRARLGGPAAPAPQD